MSRRFLRAAPLLLGFVTSSVAVFHAHAAAAQPVEHQHVELGQVGDQEVPAENTAGGVSAAGVSAGHGADASVDDLEFARDEAPPPSARTNLLIVGAAATAGFYGIGYGTSYLWPSSPVADDLRIPVVGPYSAVFNAGCGDGEGGCGTFITIVRTTLASISAIGQTGGVLMLAEALLMTTDGAPSTTPVRGAESSARGGDDNAFTWYAAPVVDGQQVGVFFGGSFF